MPERVDRLSALLKRFDLSFRPCSRQDGNLFLLGEAERRAPDRVVFLPKEEDVVVTAPPAEALLSARVDWGGTRNPLLCGLPDRIDFPLADDPEMESIAVLVIREFDQRRCGAVTMMARLGEGMMVRLFRAQIEANRVAGGVLGGLADPRLSRAIVAMHDQPSAPWRVETLAAEAGLSTSRFAELFRETVGTTPLAYLRDWRLLLARKDIERGERVQTVANRYCYGSTEALSRAIKHAYGDNPRRLKKAAQAHSRAQAHGGAVATDDVARMVGPEGLQVPNGIK